MSKTLKLEISVADLGQDGVIVSEFATTDYVASELAKKATLNDEGKVDPSLLPDYTYVDGLVDKLDDVEQSLLENDTELLQTAKTYSDQKLSESMSRKADLVNGKVPESQLPYPLGFASTIENEFTEVRNDVQTAINQLASQLSGNLDSAKAYTDEVDGARKTYVDNALNEFKGEVNSELNQFSGKLNDVEAEYKSGKVPGFTSLTDGYALHSRVMLDNGDIVKNTVEGNTANPNIDMTGWVNDKEQQKLINNELYAYKQPVIYASNLKTDGTDQIEVLRSYADEAIAKKLKLVLPSGIISISDEFVVKDTLKMESASGDFHNTTVLKWIGSNGTNKAVIRASKAPVGVTPPWGLSNVVIKNICIDADGCDFGFYARYLTDESYIDGLTARKATKCCIWGGQLWFVNFGKIFAQQSKSVGVCFGVPLAGEVDDLAVNAISFEAIRSHRNGEGGLVYDYNTGRYEGAGVILRTEGCAYKSIQSELNVGIGLVDRSVAASNFFGTVYLEGNTKNYTTRGITYLNEAAAATLSHVTLMPNQRLYNNGDIVSILSASNTGLTKAFGDGTGKFKLYANTYSLTRELTSEEYTSSLYIQKKVIKDFGMVTFKYGGDDFSTTQNIAIAHAMPSKLVIYPTAVPTQSGTITLIVNDTYVYVAIDKDTVVVGKPIIKALPTLPEGISTLRLGDAGFSSGFECNMQIVAGRLSDDSYAEKVKINGVIG